MAEDVVPTFEELARQFWEAVRDNASQEELMQIGYQMVELYPKEFETYEAYMHTMAAAW